MLAPVRLQPAVGFRGPTQSSAPPAAASRTHASGQASSQQKHSRHSDSAYSSQPTIAAASGSAPWSPPQAA
jgi:hypothetical protein